MKNPILICSVPKSGTYMLAEFLAVLGLSKTNWHIGPKAWQDYSGSSLSDARRKPELFTHREPAASTVRRIPPGAFAVSHLGPRDFAFEGAADRLKVIFLHRNLREAVVSYVRWNARTERAKWTDENGWRSEADPTTQIIKFLDLHGARIRNDFSRLTDWIGRGDVLDVSFHDLRGDRGDDLQYQCASRIARFVGMSEANTDIKTAVTQALASETLTKSEGAKNAPVWNDLLEAIFVRLGFQELNTAFGYR